MSKLDLSDAKVKQALDDVTNSKLVYALLKHEGVSNKVIVASTGNGLRDMIDDLNDGTIMYALIRFVINDATKFVYVVRYFLKQNSLCSCDDFMILFIIIITTKLLTSSFFDNQTYLILIMLLCLIAIIMMISTLTFLRFTHHNNDV